MGCVLRSGAQPKVRGVFRPASRGTEAHRLYRLHYCGVCRTMAGNYGRAASLCMTYESVFFSALASAGVGPPSIGLTRSRCTAFPLRHVPHVDTDSWAAQLGAHVNVLQAYLWGRDAQIDGDGTIRRFATAWASRAMESTSRWLQDNGLSVAECLDILDAERTIYAQPRSDLLAYVDPLGRLCERISADLLGRRLGHVAEHGTIGYCLGQLLGLVDGLQDLRQDISADKPNPYVAAGIATPPIGGVGNRGSLSEVVRPYFITAVESLQIAVEAVLAPGRGEAIRGVVYGGLPARIDRVFRNVEG
jgi:hypothetical protein